MSQAAGPGKQDLHLPLCRKGGPSLFPSLIVLRVAQDLGLECTPITSPQAQLLGKTPVRLCHRLNLQDSALTLISDFLPSLNGTDQIKPRQHCSLTVGLVLYGEQRRMSRLWEVGEPMPSSTVARSFSGKKRHGKGTYEVHRE